MTAEQAECKEKTSFYLEIKERFPGAFYRELYPEGVKALEEQGFDTSWHTSARILMPGFVANLLVKIFPGLDFTPKDQQVV